MELNLFMTLHLKLKNMTPKISSFNCGTLVLKCHLTPNPHPTPTPTPKSDKNFMILFGPPNVFFLKNGP